MLLLSFAAASCNGHQPPETPETSEAPEAQGSEKPQEPAAASTSTASVVLAGGCFWCTEAVFEQLEGVTQVVSGYAGGAADAANYQAVSAGLTEHAEAIRISYDPQKISLEKLLEVFFTVAHDPTQRNRQGPDTGRQYRSAVFYASEEEMRIVKDVILKLEADRVYDRPIVTTLERLTQFHRAEDYHQDYVRLNPAQPYVVYNAKPKVAKVRKKYADQVRENK